MGVVPNLRGILGATAAFALWLTGAPVAAQASLAIEASEGPGHAVARSSVVADIQSNGLRVIETGAVLEAKRRLGLPDQPDAAAYRALSRALGVDVYLAVMVVQRPGRWTVRVRVRGVDGARLAELRWSGATRDALYAPRLNAYRRLSRYLPEPASEAAVARVAEPAPVTEPAPFTEPVRATEPPPAGRRSRAGRERRRARARRRRRDLRYDAVVVSLGAGFQYRWLRTSAEVYAAQRGATPSDPARELLSEARTYQSAGIGHPEAMLRFALFPGALGDQPFPYLGLVAHISHSLALETGGFNSTSGERVSVSSDQYEYYVGARARYRFGSKRREPQVRLDIGYGGFHFDLDLDALRTLRRQDLIPKLRYGYVSLGAGVRYGLIPRYLFVSAEFEYRVGTSIGKAARDMWGTATGPGSAFLGGLSVRLELPEVVEGAFIALSAQFFQFSTDFRGQVACATPGGCDAAVAPWEDRRLWEPWPVDPAQPQNLDAVVGGVMDAVRDNYLRFQLSVGYAFSDV